MNPSMRPTAAILTVATDLALASCGSSGSGTSETLVVQSRGGELDAAGQAAFYDPFTQIGQPKDLYSTPENEFVATLLGDSNRVPVEPSDDQSMWKADDGSLLPAKVTSRPEAPVLVVRPEIARIVDPIDGAIQDHVSDVMYVGDHVRVSVSTAAGVLVAKVFGADAPRTPRRQENVGLSWSPEDAAR